MRFKVPQNVQREDKLVAFLTLRHLIILGVGGGLAYSVFVILNRNYFAEIWAPPVIVISVITLAIAFLKIGDLPFLNWLLLQIEYALKTQKRTWQKMSGDVFISRFAKKKKKITKTEKKAQKKLLNDAERFKSINEITEILDSHVEATNEKKEKHKKIVKITSNNQNHDE